MCVFVFKQQQDGLSAQFSQMNLVRQPSGDAPDPHTGLYPQSLVLQNPPPTGYMLSSAGQPMSGHAYPHPTPVNQAVLQPHGYIQQPMQQVQAHVRGTLPASCDHRRGFMMRCVVCVSAGVGVLLRSGTVFALQPTLQSGDAGTLQRPPESDTATATDRYKHTPTEALPV